MNRSIILCSLALLLSGCDSVKSSLGMDHYQPDEFNIKENQSLSIPPNYKLMPPRTKDSEGKSVPLNASAEKAKQAVGGGESQASLSTESLDDLKGKVGSEDDAIRKTVDEESKQEGDSALDKKLNAWKKEFTKNANSLNAPAESAKTETKKPDEETPVQKLKEQLAKDKSTGDHEDTLETKIEHDIEEKAPLETAGKTGLEIEQIRTMKN